MLFEDSLPAVYDEIDYNLVDGYWLIARVQSYEPPPSSLFGGKLRVVFACGVQELVHELDLSRPEDVKRIAPVGTFSIPFVAKQPVDVLVRTPKSSIGGALEQWQKGLWLCCAYNEPIVHQLMSTDFYLQVKSYTLAPIYPAMQEERTVA